MKPVYVCLVSAQAIPNLLGARFFDPGFICLVVTPAMQTNALRLQEQLQSRAKVELHLVRHSTALSDLYESADKLASRLAERFPGAQIVLNVTGGTKPMALAFLNAFSRLEGVVNAYVDTAHNQVEFLGEGAGPPQPLTVNLSARQYLSAQNATWLNARSDDRAECLRIFERQPATDALARRVWIDPKHADWLGNLNEVVSKLRKRVDDDRKIWNDPNARSVTLREPASGELVDALDSLGQQGYLELDGRLRRITFHRQEILHYLSGGWLEEFVFIHARKAGIADSHCGVRIRWHRRGKSRPTNELDLVAACNNRLLLVEAKTGLVVNRNGTGQAIIYRLTALAEAAGGLFGEGWLLSARRIDNFHRDLARTFRIETIEGKELEGLQARLAKWSEQAARGDAH